MTSSNRRSARRPTLAAAATFALLTLAACGGGGSGSGNLGNGSPPNTDPPVALFGVESTVAETAARSSPRLGSVTQSSNAANDVTLDTANVDHATNGDLILRISRDTGASREISTGGNVASLDVTYRPPGYHPLFLDASIYEVNLRDRTDGTFVYAATTRRASIVPAPGVRIFREGDSAIGLLDQSWEFYAGHESFLVSDNNYVGLYCVSESGTCRVEDSQVVEGAIYLKADGPAVVPDWDSNDTDYLALGAWLRPARSGTTQPEVGVFVDGGRPFSQPEFTTLTGTATYAGSAGAYALGDSNAADVAPFLLPSSEGAGRMQLFGAIELTADFGAQAIEGEITLSGDPDNYDTPGEPQQPGHIVLNLGRAPIDTVQPGGFFVGDTASGASSSVLGLAGKWGGQFYGVPGNGGRPPYATGTFGAQREGFSVLGGFIARDGADVNNFLPEPPQAAPGPAPQPPAAAPSG